MTPARWRQIEDLYFAAKDRDPGQRPAFLAGACGGDGELLAKVEAMLARDSSEDRILDRLPDGGFADFTEPQPTPVSEDRHLGPYRIEGLLGEGGMGKVYRAYDTRLNRPVAIKISSREFSERFEREARAIAALNHPHICTLHDLATSPDGFGCLVMELLEGETLAEQLKRAARLKKGGLPIELALRYGTQIAGALVAAHAKGIVHRDLKPGNIMVTKTGIKVLDFGLAKMAGEPASRSAMGTPGYMAPEQVDGREADPRTDIFAFGLVLYEMTTGERTAAGVRPQLDALPEKLAHVVDRCIEPDPENRWQTARDLNAEMDWAAQPAGAAASPAQDGFTATRGLSHIWGLAGWLTAVLAILAAAFLYLRHPEPEARIVRSTILPPEKTDFAFGTNYGSLAMSPDGRRLVFAATGEDGKSQLWIRSLESSKALPLEGTEGARLPFWSPNSRWVGFFADSKLKKIDTEGGPAIALADALDPTGGSWSDKDGGTIVFSPVAASGPLLKISSAGGATTPTTAVNPAEGISDHSPRFLPDGEHFLFATVTAAGRGGLSLRVGSLSSTSSKVIGPVDSDAAYAEGRLLFLRGGTLVAQPFDMKVLWPTGEAVPVAERVESLVRPAGIGVFSASTTGMLAYRIGAPASSNSWQLTWFDRLGKQTGTVGEPGPIRQVRLSPDRKTLAATFIFGAGRSDLWTYDLARGLPTRFTSGTGVNLNPVWSPDGKTIAFTSPRAGHFDLYRKPANGSAPEELLYADGKTKIPYSWSPDGKALLFGTTTPDGDLYVLPLTPETPGGPLKPVPFRENKFYESAAQFSPDGKWVVYASNEAQQAEIQDIYVAPLSRPAERRRVSPNGGRIPRWRKDGKEIFFVTPEGKLMAAEVRISEGAVEVSVVRMLFGGIPTSSPQPYDVSADGQRFLVTVPVASPKTSEPITLVQNWSFALRK